MANLAPAISEAEVALATACPSVSAAVPSRSLIEFPMAASADVQPDRHILHQPVHHFHQPDHHFRHRQAAPPR